MILKKEIEKTAEAQSVLKNTIDKDWILGHFIDGIYSIPELKHFCSILSLSLSYLGKSK